MDSDLAMVVGIVLAVLSIPSILSAVTDRRSPRASAITILIAGGLIVFALRENPGRYSFENLPEVFVSVAADFLP
ncbi:hypothetical protein HKX23_09895 [Sulfitobacter sp. KE29]|uniref:hypothetical protein n=1 Tax=Sulfitobacter TaxID=60136 RepID=UPI0007C28104|nr:MULTISPECIES: hypothetical protein [unclassified Sulfitobacter]MDH4540341.1 hypothetical protein [Sulfitobacter faviae]KZY51923.1 hypothetical protein A3734_03765 [Sulfitobacter sp. HI0054]MDF3418766.1 hypothetical protein [Sulfitobacter sp. Ks38]MDF3426149.1 hypothetical protein [Sulfitobacter sp. KE29]MDF3429729.1 hypothetical protein [Sulfitobacter sp. S46]